MLSTKQKEPQIIGVIPGSQDVNTSVSLNADGITSISSCQSMYVPDTYTEHTEVRKEFEPRKKRSILLAESYDRLGFSGKADKVDLCGAFLHFGHNVFPSGKVDPQGHLTNARFCRDRLCPQCSRRRSLKIFAQLSQVLDSLQLQPFRYRLLYLTLTIPNCSGADLSSTIDLMMKSWNRLVGYKLFKTSIQGYFRTMEITRNSQTGMYHPHFHVILAVFPEYFKKDYISHEMWLKMWRKATRDDRICQVNIKPLKGGSPEELQKSILEVSKYSAKDADYLVSDPDLTDRIVSVLSVALVHRRFCSYGGILKQIFNDLQFEDAEDENADLLHIGDDRLNPALDWLITRFKWSVGASYDLLDAFIEPASVHSGNRIRR